MLGMRGLYCVLPLLAKGQSQPQLLLLMFLYMIAIVSTICSGYLFIAAHYCLFSIISAD